MTIFKREDVLIRRDFEGNVIKCKRANLGTEIKSGNLIECFEKINKNDFWKIYNETKKYNPWFSKKDLLRSCILGNERYLKGFALQDNWKIDFLADSMLLKYTVKVQYIIER